MVGSADSTRATGRFTTLAPLRPLLGEINDLKRIRVAGRPGSLAEQGFVRAWAGLVAGEDPSRVAARETAAAVVAARLGGIDAPTLRDAGLSHDAIRAIFADAVRAIGGGLDLGWLEPGLIALATTAPPLTPRGDLPAFVALLCAQPRAGATRPGHPRLILEPPENHAEHCQITAVYAALAAPLLGADPTVAFLAGLSHHFHNAYLPDSGFTGEELLGGHLVPIMDRFTARALEQLPAALVDRVRAARSVLPSAELPEGQAFNAGDVFDRVLQMEQYSRVAAFETRQALLDLDLVHPGPLQAFHQEVLGVVGLWS